MSLIRVFFVLTAASASICVRGKGAMPSMPDRKAVLELLKEHPSVAEESFSLPNVGSGQRTRATLQTKGGASLSMTVKGDSLRGRGFGTTMRSSLPGAAASRWNLPFQVVTSHKVLPVRFGMFAF